MAPPLNLPRPMLAAVIIALVFLAACGPEAVAIPMTDGPTNVLQRVSVDSSANQGNAASGEPSVSGGGRFVAFWSDASNLVPGDINGAGDVFVRDRQTGETRRLSRGPNGGQGEGLSASPSISSDARFVAFQSEASNLVPGDTNGHQDVFVASNPLHD